MMKTCSKKWNKYKKINIAQIEHLNRYLLCAWSSNFCCVTFAIVQPFCIFHKLARMFFLNHAKKNSLALHSPFHRNFINNSTFRVNFSNCIVQLFFTGGSSKKRSNYNDQRCDRQFTAQSFNWKWDTNFILWTLEHVIFTNFSQKCHAHE